MNMRNKLIALYHIESAFWICSSIVLSFEYVLIIDVVWNFSSTVAYRLIESVERIIFGIQEIVASSDPGESVAFQFPIVFGGCLSESVGH